MLVLLVAAIMQASWQGLVPCVCPASGGRLDTHEAHRPLTLLLLSKLLTTMHAQVRRSPGSLDHAQAVDDPEACAGGLVPCCSSF